MTLLSIPKEVVNRILIERVKKEVDRLPREERGRLSQREIVYRPDSHRKSIMIE